MRQVRFLPLALAFLLVAAPGARPEPGRNLVRNPGFEVGDPLPADWTIHEDVHDHSRGTTVRDTQVVRAGAASLRLSLPAGGPDVQAVVQTWEVGGALRDLRGQPLFFTAWLKARDVGYAHVWLEFIDAKQWQISIHNLSPTRPIAGSAEWCELGRVVTVPEDTQVMALGISLYYRGDLWVDDVGLWRGMGEAETAAAVARTSPPAMDHTATLLSEVQGAVFATATGAAADGEAKVILSVPFPFAGQAPLSFRVGSIPEDRIHAVKVARFPHEDAVEVGLKAIRPGETVRLFWQSLVLTSNRPIDPRALVQARIATPESLTPELRAWLVPEPGVEIEAPLVQGMAERLKTYQGYTLDFLQGLNSAIQNRLSLREGGPGPHGADHVLTKKRAAEIGYANAVTAVARAGNVPTRMLLAVPWERAAGEACLTEFHIPGVGWMRSDPVSGAFPAPEHDLVAIRVIAPNEARLADGVPVPVRWSGPLRAGPIQGALKQAAALRAERVDGVWLSHAQAAALLAKPRERWEEAFGSALGTEARMLRNADLPLNLAAALTGRALGDPDGVVDAAFRRHATWLESLSMGWGQSLVRNPGFEEENRGRPSGWHLPSDRRLAADIGVTAEGALRGERTLHAVLRETRNRYEVISQRVTRFPVGLPLVLSAYVQGRCDGDVILAATYLDDARNPIDRPALARTSLDGGGEWKRLSLDLEAPRLAATLQVQILTEGAGDLRVDEFDLRAGGGFPAYPGEELLMNPGFEEGGTDALPAAWRSERRGAPAAEALDLAQEVSGRNSKWAAYTASTAEMAEAAFIQLVRHVPSTGRVRLTGWVKTDRLSGIASLSLAFRATPFEETAAPSQRIGTETTQPVRSTAAWTQVSLEAEVPPETLSIEVRATSRGSGRTWWDDLSLQAIPK